MVEPLKMFFFRTKKALGLNPGMEHRGLKPKGYQVCSNDDCKRTFNLFYGKVKCASPCICMGKMLKSYFLRLYELETIAETYNV